MQFNGQEQDVKMRVCPHCNGKIPEQFTTCPLCGEKIRPKLGELTDAEVKRIKRPLTIILCIVLAIVLYFKYFKNPQPIADPDAGQTPITETAEDPVGEEAAED